MGPSIPAEQRDVIARHKHDTILYVLAESPPCSARRDRLLERIPKPRTTKMGTYGRDVRAVEPDDLGAIDLDSSWCLAILVCRGDGMERLLAWARGGLDTAAQARIRFYVAPRLDPVRAVDPWTSAVAPVVEAVQPATDTSLARLALVQINEQVYADHASPKPPGVP